MRFALALVIVICGPALAHAAPDGEGDPIASEPAAVIVDDMRIVLIQYPHFDHESSAIRDADLPVLEQIATILREHPEILRVCVVGHADRSERRAQALSARRARAVRDWLVAHGVEPARLEVASYGATHPLVPPQPIALRGRNRRVQFVLVQRAEERAEVTAGSEAAVPRE